MPIEISDAEKAFSNIRSNRYAKWPDGRKSNQGRLGLYANVEMQPSFGFSLDDSILTIGSCFAREIEKRLLGLGFNVPLSRIDIPRDERSGEFVNNILNKYVPHAMANELRWMFDPEASFPDDAYLQLSENEWHDPHLAANLKPASLNRVKERRRHVYEVYQSAKSAKIVIITLGLVEAWFDFKTSLYLNEAPPASAVKNYPGRFQFHLLSYDDVLFALEDIYDVLNKYGHPEIKILLTVSPVPFKVTFTGTDAMQANTYSKSVLRAAAEAFSRMHSNVDYFPSYEIVTLGDRSATYRIDNIHVRDEVVARIMNQVVREYANIGIEVNDEKKIPIVERPTELSALALYGYAKKLALIKDYLTASNVMRNIDETYGDVFGVFQAEFYLNFGVWLLKAKQIQAGEREIGKAILIDPKNARAHYMHGLAFSRLKNYDEAVKALQEAVRLSPDVAKYRWRLGEEYRHIGKNKLATDELQAALHLDPSHSQAKATLDAIGNREFQ